MNTEVNPRNVVYGKLKTIIEQNNSEIPQKRKLKDEEVRLLTQNIEKGIYNKTIEFSDSKNIPKKWDNSTFVDMYRVFSIEVYSNLDKESIFKTIDFLKDCLTMNLMDMNLRLWNHNICFPSIGNHLLMRNLKEIEHYTKLIKKWLPMCINVVGVSEGNVLSINFKQGLLMNQ